MSSAIDQQVVTFQEQFKRVKQEVSKVIVGYSEIIDGVLMSMLASGHVPSRRRSGWERRSSYRL